MSAPTGNSNAQKWTIETTLAKLLEVRAEVEHDHVLTLAHALAEVGLYIGLWSYWKKRFADELDIEEQIGYIETRLIARIERAALTKKLHAGTCQFILKHSYGIGKPAREAKKEEEHIAEVESLKEQIQTLEKKVKEVDKARMLLKVQAYNVENPNWKISEYGLYTDEAPDHSGYIMHAPGFYTIL